MTIDGYEDVPENDEKALKKAVANQPVSVAIEAGGREFQLYQSVMALFKSILLIIDLSVFGRIYKQHDIIIGDLEFETLQLQFHIFDALV